MTYRDWDKVQSKASYKRQWQAAVRGRAQARHENRIHTECLALAVETLGQIGGPANEALVLGILAEIEARLAQLEPEEETE